jgi:hypothetical protein
VPPPSLTENREVLVAEAGGDHFSFPALMVSDHRMAAQLVRSIEIVQLRSIQIVQFRS